MLKEKIQENLTAALKNKDIQSLSTLRLLMSEIKNKEINKGTTLEDADVIQIIKKQVKELENAMELFEKAGRDELTTENKEQIAILIQYLPIEISDDELRSEIKKIMEEKKDQYAQNPKSFIGICVTALKSKADPQRIVKLLNEIQN